eukprot:scaffold18824_cov77-Cyclotella_meneghiniana.AAC.1
MALPLVFIQPSGWGGHHSLLSSSGPARLRKKQYPSLTPTSEVHLRSVAIILLFPRPLSPNAIN